MDGKLLRLGILSASLFALVVFAGTAAAQEKSQTGLGSDCSDRNQDRPELSLVAEPPMVMAGQRVKLVATGKSNTGNLIEYMWRADQGRIFGKGNTVEFDTVGLAPGKYTVTLIGRANKCATASLVKTVEVIGCPPSFALTSSPKVTVGEIIKVSPLGLPVGFALRWSTSEGRVALRDGIVSVDTGGFASNSVTVTATAVDIPDCTRSVVVAVAKPPVPLPDILGFPMTAARLNNAHKAVLDDVNLRSGTDVRSQIIITGRSTETERKGLARQRADNARNYLVYEKGVDASRIEVRVKEGTAKEGGIDIAIVPPGAKLP